MKLWNKYHLEITVLLTAIAIVISYLIIIL